MVDKMVSSRSFGKTCNWNGNPIAENRFLKVLTIVRMTESARSLSASTGFSKVRTRNSIYFFVNRDWFAVLPLWKKSLLFPLDPECVRV
jgi:hypothetical protein